MTLFRSTLAATLETGRWHGPVSGAASALWSRLAERSLVRPGRVPPGASVVTVGGATLGGSGKTRAALAVVRHLAGRGLRVTLVGHGYGAARGAPRRVAPTDAVASVGDEALLSARALDGVAPVVVGPTRQDAIEHALSASVVPDVLVFDGPLRIESPGLAILAVDRERPWGAGRCPPAGDLRAPRRALLDLADVVWEVDARPSSVRIDAASAARPLDALAGASLGLFTALARPERLTSALAAAGLVVRTHVRVGDHGPTPASALRTLERSRGDVDLWVATEKCALELERAAPRFPIAILGGELELPWSVERLLGDIPTAPNAWPGMLK